MAPKIIITSCNNYEIFRAKHTSVIAYDAERIDNSKEAHWYKGLQVIIKCDCTFNNDWRCSLTKIIFYFDKLSATRPWSSPVKDHSLVAEHSSK